MKKRECLLHSAGFSSSEEAFFIWFFAFGFRHFFELAVGDDLLALFVTHWRHTQKAHHALKLPDQVLVHGFVGFHQNLVRCLPFDAERGVPVLDQLVEITCQNGLSGGGVPTVILLQAMQVKVGSQHICGRSEDIDHLSFGGYREIMTLPDTAPIRLLLRRLDIEHVMGILNQLSRERGF